MLYHDGYGHFSDAGDEYVVESSYTPTPWINVISNGDWGLTISNAGGGYSWHLNANLNRITRWEQDLVADASGKWIYLHEPASGETWSPTLHPVGRHAHPICTHGLGYTRFSAERQGIVSELTVTVPLDEAGEIWTLKLVNNRATSVSLLLCTCFEWQLSPDPEGNREFHKIFIETELAANRIIATKRLYPLPGAVEPWNTDYPYHPYFTSSATILDYTDSKTRFLGRNGSWTDPAFLRAEPCCEAGKHGDGLCATRFALELSSGEEREVRFLLGVSPGLQRYLQPSSDELLSRVARSWRALFDASHIDTPEAHFDLLSNHWLKYQAVSCRLNGRAAYYQSSGASGFRDQLQDSLIYLHLDPEQTRRRILDHAAHQHRDGTVLHWWHNLTGSGPRSRFSDDLLWLPYVAYQHVLETGSDAVLEERVPFLDGPEDTIDAHCRRAIDRALARRSARGLPLIGEGDWNDGLSSCGDEERGESIWLGHFLCRVLADYATLLRRQGIDGLARAYLDEREALAAAVNAYGWDGEWYLRATLDDGEAIGSARCREGRIYLNAQTWAIIADTAPPERRAAVLSAIKTHLDREHGPLLLHPAYSEPDPRIGYITRYAPGVRENGGVYTHAACWAIQAAAMVSDAEWAYSLYEKICPVLRGQDPELYAVEPYVTAGNSDGPCSPRFGRGGWTWYTGSAGWLYRVMNEWILGVRPDPAGLLVRPCIPTRWPGFNARRLFRGKVYQIEATRGEAALILNGRELDPRAPLLGDLAVNNVTVRVP
jgi:cellobiose phosphorylase